MVGLVTVLCYVGIAVIGALSGYAFIEGMKG